jgi:hypothetical protein
MLNDADAATERAAGKDGTSSSSAFFASFFLNAIFFFMDTTPPSRSRSFDASIDTFCDAGGDTAAALMPLALSLSMLSSDGRKRPDATFGGAESDLREIDETENDKDDGFETVEPDAETEVELRVIFASSWASSRADAKFF